MQAFTISPRNVEHVHNMSYFDPAGKDLESTSVALRYTLASSRTRSRLRISFTRLGRVVTDWAVNFCETHAGVYQATFDYEGVSMRIST